MKPAFLAILFVASTVIVADVVEVAPKCPVSGAAIKKDKVSEFNGGEVYFCCGNCKAKFDGNSKPFAAKANHQLVVTKQAVQKSCPFTGGVLNDSTTLDVAGAKVNFCCANCQSKADLASGDDQINLIFSNDAFKKGFEIAEKK